MDVRLKFIPRLDGLGIVDLAIDKGDLATGRDLETAALISLFSNRRAAEDELTSETSSRQGWWGDDFPVRDGDRIGSKLWLLVNQKQTPETLARFREYVAEALQWLIDDRVVGEIRIQAEYIRLHVLGARIELLHSGGIDTRFEFQWDQIRNLLLPGDEDLFFPEAPIYVLTESGARLVTHDGIALIK